MSNPHDRDACFKVKTTAPRRYCVRPNNTRVPPHQTVEVEVLLQPMDQYPAEDKRTDKFLVQMAWLPDVDMGACTTPRGPAICPSPNTSLTWWTGRCLLQT